MRIPFGAEVVDGRGGYLIPGLWDMHIHSVGYDYGRRHLPKLVAHGITGVRDMGTPLEDALRLRNDAWGGKILSPRLVVSGPLLNGPLPFRTPLILSVQGEAAARAAVESLAARGVDFVKVHDALPRTEYLAIADEARARGVPFAGHVPPAIGAVEAAAAGQRSIEHLGGRFHGELLACSAREPELRRMIDRIIVAALQDLDAGREPDDTEIFRAGVTGLLVSSFSVDRERALIAALLRNGTWQVPTLVAQPLRAYLEDAAAPIAPADRRYGQELLRLQERLVRDMHRAGVGVLAGTDLSLEQPMLTEELVRLVMAGLSPLDALRTATLNPARFLGATDSLGVIAVGKLADLVLLEADPLTNVQNTGRVRAVVLNGRYFDRQALDQLLADAEAAAER
jgi:imidazolonepropionase-like amidohydrolase